MIHCTLGDEEFGGDLAVGEPPREEGSDLLLAGVSRVLPEPPAPVRVKSRVTERARLSSSISRSLPTKLSLGAGRLCLVASGVSSPCDETARRAGVVGNPPVAMSSCKRRVALLGSVPSLVESLPEPSILSQQQVAG